MEIHWTPTQQKIINILSDGQYHSADELLVCLDKFTDPQVLKVHLTFIRKKLEPLGQTILNVNTGRGFRYIQVRRLMPADE